MKKFLLITISFFVLGFFIPNFSFACGNNPANPEDCNAALNENLPITVFAKDEDGNIIAGVPITFNWSINTANLGVFQNGGGTWSDSNNLGQSTATLKVGSYDFSSSSPGIIQVSVVYGGGSASKVFHITTSCQRDPMLYYGIGAVSEHNANINDDTWQSSTAEVLETCHPEYMLYEGTGEGD